MLRRLRPHITFANTCSALALFVALSTGTAYAADTVFSTDIVDGEVKTPDIRNGAVNDKKVEDGSLLGLDLALGTIASSNITNESLTASDLATDSVMATEIANNAIDSGEIAADSLLASDLAGASVGASELQDAAVGGAELASNAVTGSKVAANSLTTADILGADVNGGGINIPTGYVPNGRCRQLDASVGATAGEAVIFSIKAPLQDGILIYGQRVSSNGHVMYDVCNFSGTTQAQISNLPVRLITFG